MFKRLMMTGILILAGVAPADAQMFGSGRISVEPYLGYGFFGDLPEAGPELEAAVAFGGRAAYQFSPQWALFGNFQRSNPEITGIDESEVTVDHWSAGIEFAYVPRGGAEGMLPILLEVGLGQARYDFDGTRNVIPNDVFATRAERSDLAVNLGLGSALQLSPNFAIRYGVNDYISNYADEGIANQIFVRVGAELAF